MGWLRFRPGLAEGVQVGCSQFAFSKAGEEDAQERSSHAAPQGGDWRDALKPDQDELFKGSF